MFTVQKSGNRVEVLHRGSKVRACAVKSKRGVHLSLNTSQWSRALLIGSWDKASFVQAHAVVRKGPDLFTVRRSTRLGVKSQANIVYMSMFTK